MSTSPASIARTAPRTVRAIAVAEQAADANALALLLGTIPHIDVVASEIKVDNARASIVRTRPDVVVIRSTDDRLSRFRSLLDLQLDLPDVGFVLVLENRIGGAARRAPVDRAIIVLSAGFSLAELLSSVVEVAGPRVSVTSLHDHRSRACA